jgi:hypothetical protein
MRRRVALPRTALVVALALLAATALVGNAAARSDDASPAPSAASALQEPVDQHDDTRTEVQLVVLGIAAFVVVGVGLGAYLLRKKLGLVPPPPGEQEAGHH